MIIYAIVVTIIAVVLAILALKWKIGVFTITYFCVSNFREPTDKEIKDCSEKVIRNLLKLK